MVITLHGVLGYGCKFHHTAARRGYESRKTPGHFEPYTGRFGEGFVFIHPRYDTTRFVYVDYYVF